jgi:hypothetical protein
MRKGVLVVVLLTVLGLLAYAGYHSDDKQRAGGSGQVFFRDTGQRLKTDANRSSSLNPAASSEANPNSSSSSSSDAQPDQASRQSVGETVVYPSVQAQPPAPANTEGGPPLVTRSQQTAPATAPTSDTISPNPPNGMTFSGSGRYQLYRQGNLTWRLDTETGRSCVLFATDEEWKKSRVYKAGCGRS